MGLKDLMKSKRAEHVSESPVLVQSSLLPGLEALPTAVLVIERRTLAVAFANPVAPSTLADVLA
jgi:two-component system nitrogen regulation sensor histidine kinase GlnL